MGRCLVSNTDANSADCRECQQPVCKMSFICNGIFEHGKVIGGHGPELDWAEVEAGG